METVVVINESGRILKFGGKTLKFFDDVSSSVYSAGNSKGIADYISEFSQSLPEDEETYFIPLQTITYNPMGLEVKDHSANVFQSHGKDYVIDFAFIEINPNVDYPYIDSLDHWKKDIDKISFLGVPDLIEPEPDPRAKSLPVFDNEK